VSPAPSCPFCDAGAACNSHFEAIRDDFDDPREDHAARRSASSEPK
jgi:hypothetical protein